LSERPLAPFLFNRAPWSFAALACTQASPLFSMETTMAKQPQEAPGLELENQMRDERMASIREHVLRELGSPDDLLRLQIRWLWGHNFRVNVLVGNDVASARVAHSYFVAAADDGSLLATPRITRQYVPLPAANPLGKADVPCAAIAP
jgi:hypothetical protein